MQHLPLKRQAIFSNMASSFAILICSASFIRCSQHLLLWTPSCLIRLQLPKSFHLSSHSFLFQGHFGFHSHNFQGIILYFVFSIFFNCSFMIHVDMQNYKHSREYAICLLQMKKICLVILGISRAILLCFQYNLTFFL